MKKILIISGISLVSVVLVAMCIVLIVGGVFVSQKYLKPWSKTYSQQFDDPRLKLVAHGILAASGHNMQPWKITLDQTNSDVFYLYVDRQLLTPAVDPLARQTMVTQGTLLEYMRVAGLQLGYATTFNLFPDGQYDESKLSDSIDSKPVAKISLTKTPVKVHPLYDGMFLPDTNRGAYKTTALTESQNKNLLATNLDPDLTVKIYQDQSNLKTLGDFAVAGTKIEGGIDSVNNETAAVFRSNENQKNQFRSGFSVEGQGTTGIMKYILQGLITIFPSITSSSASADMANKSTQTAVANTPAYAIITTIDNSRINQVKAGMLYSRMILTGHSDGLVMQPPSQVLQEYPEMADEYAKIHKQYATTGSTIQMFIRIGQPTTEFPVSMRRDVTSFINQQESEQ